MRDPKETVESVLQDMEVKYEPGATGFTFKFEEDGPAVEGVAHVVEERKEFVLFLVYSKRTPKKQHMEMCEFVTRVNWGIGVGNFEFDFSSGAVRYRVGVDYGNASLPKEFVRCAVLDAMNAIEEYNEAIVAVMNGKVTARKAFEATESGGVD